ncbi:GD22745 [Drosophila simulans]|uniref:GD22745 n=1 Tax=Drosophila simulans TaxID=7240 RepID=B4Q9M4_DROSI|nr:GD22745 [Drosophila simulans]
MTDYNVARSTSTSASTDCGHSDVCAPTTFRRNPWRPLVHQPSAPAPFISESYLYGMIQQPPQERPPVSRKKLNYAILRDDNPLKHSNTSH